jgi:inner membrane protein
MDNLSHSLTGLALARAGLNRLTPRAALLLLLSANLPDIDIVSLGKSQFAYLEAHRGLTHSLVALPVLAAACVMLVAAIHRQRLPWLRAWLVCCIGVASHLLLDSTNSYGIRLLIPFSRRWSHLDINSLTDGPILVALAVAAVWPWLSGLVSGEIGDAKKSAGRGIAIAALLFCGAFDACRYYLHQFAVAQLESRLYAGAPPRQVAALPTAINPFLWRGIVETESSWLTFNLNTLSQLNTESARSFFRSPLSDAIREAKRTPEFSYFSYFARFPVWSVQPVALSDAGGQRVELTDLRFGEPGRGDFHCVALENASGKILGAWFTFGSGSDLGWSEPARH